MNLQSIVVVLLRLMALNLVLQSVIQLTPTLLNYLPALSLSTPDDPRVFVWLPWIIVFGLLIAAVLLWTFALPVARLVTRPVSLDVSLGSLSLADCYAIAFVGFGLYQMVINLAGVLNWSHFMYVTAAATPGPSWKEQVNFYDVFTLFVPFIVGLILFVKGRRWAVKLAARQQSVEPPPPTREA